MRRAATTRDLHVPLQALAAELYESYFSCSKRCTTAAGYVIYFPDLQKVRVAFRITNACSCARLAVLVVVSVRVSFFGVRRHVVGRRDPGVPAAWTLSLLTAHQSEY